VEQGKAIATLLGCSFGAGSGMGIFLGWAARGRDRYGWRGRGGEHGEDGGIELWRDSDSDKII
jgi:hypothetical protein